MYYIKWLAGIFGSATSGVDEYKYKTELAADPLRTCAVVTLSCVRV